MSAEQDASCRNTSPKMARYQKKSGNNFEKYVYLQLVSRAAIDCSAAVSLSHLKERVELCPDLQKHVDRTGCIM